MQWPTMKLHLIGSATCLPNACSVAPVTDVCTSTGVLLVSPCSKHNAHGGAEDVIVLCICCRIDIGITMHWVSIARV